LPLVQEAEVLVMEGNALAEEPEGNRLTVAELVLVVEDDTMVADGNRVAAVVAEVVVEENLLVAIQYRIILVEVVVVNEHI